MAAGSAVGVGVSVYNRVTGRAFLRTDICVKTPRRTGSVLAGPRKEQGPREPPVQRPRGWAMPLSALLFYHYPENGGFRDK